MKITLRQLHYFNALATELHFGRAANRVAVTQPAMSTQIRDLEETLGGALIDRTGPLTLTPMGRAVAAKARRVLEDVAQIEELGQTDQRGVPLRLGLIPTIAPYLLPHLVPLLNHQGRRITISEALTEKLLEQVENGELDAAVIALPAQRQALVDTALFEDRFLLAMPKRALRPGWIAPARPEEIDPARLLLLDDGHCLADQTLSACSLRRDTVNLALGATSLTTVSRLVAAGQGVTLMPEIAASTEGHDVSLSRFEDPEPGREIGLTVRRGSESAPWRADLIALLREARLTAGRNAGNDAQVPGADANVTSVPEQS